MIGGDPAGNPTALPFVHWGRWFAPAALAVLVLDQASKWWLFSLPDSTPFPRWVVKAENSGVAWSLGRDHPWMVAALTLLLVPVLAVVWWKHFRQLGAWENLAFGAILGGAVGNGFDRACARFHCFHLTGVRDFINIDLGFPPANPWPTFNLADAGITGGFLVLVVLSFCKPRVAAPGAVAAMSDR